MAARQGPYPATLQACPWVKALGSHSAVGSRDSKPHALHYKVSYAAADLLKGAASLEASFGTLCSQVVRVEVSGEKLPLAIRRSH